MDLVVAIKVLQETYKEKQQDLHIVSLDAEKALVYSPHIYDMEHQANYRDSRGMGQCDTVHVQRSDY